jgi:hypothetical protein
MRHQHRVPEEARPHLKHLRPNDKHISKIISILVYYFVELKTENLNVLIF